ncbi:MAG: hypothetical protein ACE5J4_02520 [Candidatus Aenigmatarchaeota archaeon]
MKGQFFIISSVIMISAMILMVQYLYDFNKLDLTKLQEMYELDYIQMIKDSLAGTIDNSNCNRLEQDLEDAEEFLKDQLIKKGIRLEIYHEITSNCPTTYFNFSLITSNLYTYTEFTYP